MPVCQKSMTLGLRECRAQRWLYSHGTLPFRVCVCINFSCIIVEKIAMHNSSHNMTLFISLYSNVHQHRQITKSRFHNLIMLQNGNAHIDSPSLNHIWTIVYYHILMWCWVYTCVDVDDQSMTSSCKYLALQLVWDNDSCSLFEFGSNNTLRIIFQILLIWNDKLWKIFERNFLKYQIQI